MEERKWEDMNSDCLVNIFGRLELLSRVLVIPLVCKPWYLAVRNPLCWEKLFFPHSFVRLRSQTELIKFVVDRSQRCANILALPNVCDREELIYVSDKCPALKFLWLPYDVCFEHKDIIPSLIVKWKNLEVLCLGHTIFIKEILELIHIHLPNFTGLGLKSGDVDDETASAIVSLVPKLKFLLINDAILKKKNLLLILQGCKELEYVDVQNCMGFDKDDAEILKLSSGIKIFRCDGSTAMVPFDFTNFDFDDAIANFDFNIDFNIFKGIEGDEYEWDGMP